jgi:hypothetical protein
MLTASANVLAQFRPGARSTIVSVVSPAVVASWRTFDNHAGVSTSVLVLWRGAAGWLGKAIAPSSSNSGSSSPTFTYGDRAIRIDYDDTAGTATVLKRQFSLKDVNVVLVDGVDRGAGPTVAASRWAPPGPPAPPLMPGAMADPIAGIVMRRRTCTITCAAISPSPIRSCRRSCRRCADACAGSWLCGRGIRGDGLDQGRTQHQAHADVDKLNW